MRARLAAAFAAATLALGPTAGSAIPLHGVHEIVIRDDVAHDGSQGAPNPFDIDVVAHVSTPDGRELEVPGFFDGDGAGGMVGDVFVVRLALDVEGTWRWRIASERSALDGQQGEVRCCAGRLAGRFGAGPLETDPRHPRAFRIRESGPLFLVGKFLDFAAPVPLRFSHTFWSEELSDGDRERLLDRHLGMELNKLNVYVANRGDYGGIATTPWLGTAAANDKTRFDLARWHLWERWLERLRDEGMVAHLWLFADDSGFGGLPEADRRRLIRQTLARLSAYPNTLFTLALEWQEGWSPQEVRSHATHLQEHNPWRRLVSVHGVTGDVAFAEEPWCTFLELQAGNDASWEAVYDLGIRNRRRAEKPLIQEEHGLGRETAENRRKAWAALASGAAGIGTGAFLAPLARFARAVPLHATEPDAGILAAGDALVLADPGRHYVLVLPEGGSVDLDLPENGRGLTAEWFDPRTGRWQRAVVRRRGPLARFAAPSADDWVLYLHP